MPISQKQHPADEATGLALSSEATGMCPLPEVESPLDGVVRVGGVSNSRTKIQCARGGSAVESRQICDRGLASVCRSRA
jgi:hypothetical protein